MQAVNAATYRPGPILHPLAQQATLPPHTAVRWPYGGRSGLPHLVGPTSSALSRRAVRAANMGSGLCNGNRDPVGHITGGVEGPRFSPPFVRVDRHLNKETQLQQVAVTSHGVRAHGCPNGGGTAPQRASSPRSQGEWTLLGH